MGRLLFGAHPTGRMTCYCTGQTVCSRHVRTDRPPRPVTLPASFGQNRGMRDLVHGVIGALIAYAVYKLAGHAIWSLAALALYVPVYLKARDRIPFRGRGRTSDRT